MSQMRVSRLIRKLVCLRAVYQPLCVPVKYFARFTCNLTVMWRNESSKAADTSKAREAHSFKLLADIAPFFVSAKPG